MTTDEEVEDGNVDDVQQSSSAVVRTFRSHLITVPWLGLPAWQLAALGVQLCPGVGPGPTWTMIAGR